MFHGGSDPLAEDLFGNCEESNESDEEPDFFFLEPLDFDFSTAEQSNQWKINQFPILIFNF